MMDIETARRRLDEAEKRLAKARELVEIAKANAESGDPEMLARLKEAKKLAAQRARQRTAARKALKALEEAQSGS